MNKIEENWKSIFDAEKKCKEKTGDPLAGFNADSFFLGKQGKVLMIRLKYRKKYKRKGEDVFSKNYSDMMIIADFCPFTGKPLYEEDKE